MKPISFLFAAVSLFAAVVPTRAEVDVSVDFFHDNLESYGDWREVGGYGYCWQPRAVDAEWRPYSDGRWLYTDAGWTWDSEEPYSWAVYHYGRWARLDRVGWIWVPGTEWGPAWVSWRRGGEHVGWAPLPPDAAFDRSVGFSSRVDADYDIGPSNYNFVELRNFGAPHLRTVIVEPRNNITFIQRTQNITRISYVNNVVYNDGPQYDVISRESAMPIPRMKLERRLTLDGDPGRSGPDQYRTRVEGNSLRVLALPFATRPATAPRKVVARVEQVEVDRGWKNAGSPAEVTRLREKIKTEPVAVAEPAGKGRSGRSAEGTAVPATAVAATPAPEATGAKRKGRNNGTPAAPTAAADAAVATPADPAVTPPDAPKAGMGKNRKAAKPVTGEVPAAPAAAENTPPAGEPKKRRNEERAVSPTPADPATTTPPAAGAGDNTPRSKQPRAGQEARPKADAPAARPAPDAPVKPEPRAEREANPAKPEARPERKNPESRPAPAAGAATSPEATPAAKGKGKGKGKDEKKTEEEKQ